MSDFSTLKSISHKPIQGVGDSAILAMAIGQMHLCLANDSYLILDNTLYVPKATVRLLLVSSMAKKTEIFTTFGDTGATLFKKVTNTLVVSGTLLPMKNLYALNLHDKFALSVHSFSSIIMWHHHLGHANYQTIIEMAKSGMIEGMPPSFSFKAPKCDKCIYGKQARTPVPKIREEELGHRATWRLGIVWVDLTGKQDITSWTGNSYIMNIVDDYMNKPWSILLRLKSNAFNELKAWILACQVETGLQLGILQSGNDSEIIAKENKAWYHLQGITTQHGAVYMLIHLGHIEQMHRTLIEKSIAIRIYVKCSAFLWNEFYLTATHLHGKTKMSAVKDVTSDELWYGKKPNYSYICEIGCQVFILVLGKHNSKIYEMSIECFLIGYDLEAKAYHCYDRASKQVYSTYHIKFIEHQDNYNTSDLGMMPAQYTESTDIPSSQIISKNVANQPFIIPEDNNKSIPAVNNRPEQALIYQTYQ